MFQFHIYEAVDRASHEFSAGRGVDSLDVPRWLAPTYCPTELESDFCGFRARLAGLSAATINLSAELFTILAPLHLNTIYLDDIGAPALSSELRGSLQLAAA